MEKPSCIHSCQSLNLWDFPLWCSNLVNTSQKDRKRYRSSDSPKELESPLLSLADIVTLGCLGTVNRRGFHGAQSSRCKALLRSWELSTELCSLFWTCLWIFGCRFQKHHIDIKIPHYGRPLWPLVDILWPHHFNGDYHPQSFELWDTSLFQLRGYLYNFTYTSLLDCISYVVSCILPYNLLN
jgi:hypothetical protein